MNGQVQVYKLSWKLHFLHSEYEKACFGALSLPPYTCIHKVIHFEKKMKSKYTSIFYNHLKKEVH